MASATVVSPFPGFERLHILRGTWHSAQHARQIQVVLQEFGVAPDGPLTEQDFAGLPLPDGLWE